MLIAEITRSTILIQTEIDAMLWRVVGQDRCALLISKQDIVMYVINRSAVCPQNKILRRLMEYIYLITGSPERDILIKMETGENIMIVERLSMTIIKLTTATPNITLKVKKILMESICMNGVG